MNKEQLTLPWEEKEGSLVYTFVGEDFLDIISFVNDIAKKAQEMDHHPSLRIHSYNKLTVSLTTHDADGITDKDIDLAYVIEVLWKNRT